MSTSQFNILIFTDVEPDDMIAIVTLMDNFSRRNISVDCTFVVGEGNPRTKERLLREYGIKDDIILGVSSEKKHPETILQDGQMDKGLSRDNWDQSDHALKVKMWMIKNPSGLIISIKPCWELVSIVKTDENLLEGKTILHYGSFNFRQLLPENKIDLLLLVNRPGSYVFETYLAFKDKNNVDENDKIFPWTDFQQHYPRLFDSMCLWNRSIAENWLLKLSSVFKIESFPNWNEDQPFANKCNLVFPNGHGEIDLFDLVNKGQQESIILHEILYGKSPPGDFLTFWRTLKGLSSVLPSISKQFVNADTGLISAIIMNPSESKKYLATATIVFTDGGFTAPKFDPVGKVMVWAPSQAFLQKNGTICGNDLEKEFRGRCLEILSESLI